MLRLLVLSSSVENVQPRLVNYLYESLDSCAQSPILCLKRMICQACSIWNLCSTLVKSELKWSRKMQLLGPLSCTFGGGRPPYMGSSSAVWFATKKATRRCAEQEQASGIKCKPGPHGSHFCLHSNSRLLCAISYSHLLFLEPSSNYTQDTSCSL